MSDLTGIIYPPLELRGIVDGTARYVAKNGEAFEERIKREHRDKPKFSFLSPDDPFNAYYQHKVRELRASFLTDLERAPKPQRSEEEEAQQGESQEETRRPTPDPTRHSIDRRDESGSREQSPESKRQRLSSGRNDDQQSPIDANRPEDPSNDYQEASATTTKVRPQLNDYMQDMQKKLEEPPPLNYLATPAPSLRHMECDIIKLTAQFIATHGRSFLLELVSREHGNSQFDFLKPQHGQFSYVNNLIEQYTLIRNRPPDIVGRLQKDATSQRHVLDKIRMRADWTAMLELEKKKKQEAEEEEKQLYLQIDWHDFVIVETIEFQSDEKGEYPPTTADQVGTRLLLQQRYEEQHVPEEMEIDDEMDLNDD